MPTRTYHVLEERDGRIVEVPVTEEIRLEDEYFARIKEKSQAALESNAVFLADNTPTNAQLAAQVKRLTRQNNALIRMTLGLLDSEDDT